MDAYGGLAALLTLEASRHCMRELSGNTDSYCSFRQCLRSASPEETGTSQQLLCSRSVESVPDEANLRIGNMPTHTQELHCCACATTSRKSRSKFASSSVLDPLFHRLAATHKGCSAISSTRFEVAEGLTENMAKPKPANIQLQRACPHVKLFSFHFFLVLLSV